MKMIFLIIAAAGLSGNAGEPNCPNLYIRFVGDRNGITIGFETIPCYTYEVQKSTNLVNWTSVTNFCATGYVFSTFLSSDPADVNKQQYLRIKYQCQ